MTVAQSAAGSGCGNVGGVRSSPWPCRSVTGRWRYGAMATRTPAGGCAGGSAGSTKRSPGIRALPGRAPVAGHAVHAPRGLLQKSDGSRDPPNRQSEALKMTKIWPPAGATAHFRAVSMCRVTLDTAVDTFATGSYRLRFKLGGGGFCCFRYGCSPHRG